ncbi:hypothetical protein DSO57_1010547 [Entomophthora muscae]|uniref:Uncharacterized protein n=1 Tax=Entomophthora muscae TaxID=34485 RepID=A0ACC2SVX2_9FUNG|nr:hypothetical protein DSO57_1010547 [Entomophthora muscae]
MDLGLAQSLGLLLLPPRLSWLSARWYSQLFSTASVREGSSQVVHISQGITRNTFPFVLLGMLVPFKDAFDVILSNVLLLHSCHNLTFKPTMNLVKIDAPMYPLSELKDKALGT